MAAHAALSRFDNREMIALDVESIRHCQHAAWTVLNAEFAALAALLNDRYGAPAYVDFFSIKGRAPEFHTVFFPEVSGLSKIGYVQPL